jgi:outer membrane immunogenic protein
MKQFFVRLAFSVAALLPASSVLAADLDIPPPPVEELRPATYDWSGAYVGVWAGAACIDGTITDNTAGVEYLNAGCGGKGGLLAGYNYQIDSLVLGIEGDWGKSGTIVENNDPTADFSYKLDSIATLRARVGYAIDDTLIFVTGGGAWAKGNLDGIVSATPNNLTASHTGWTIGGGVEQAVTDNFHLKLDYLYTKLGKGSYSSACCDVTGNWGSEHEIRVGAIWAFGTW